MFSRPLLVVLAFVTCTTSLQLTVSGTGGNTTSSLLYGLLFEDVYHSGDGGIYGEMIQNRAMQGVDLVNGEPNRNLVKWHNLPGCDLEMDNSAPLLSTALPYQMSATVPAGGSGSTGLWNEGYAGFNVTTATRYETSFWIRGNFNGEMIGSFISNTTNATLGSTTFSISQTASEGWIQYTKNFTVTESAPDFQNTFHLTFDAEIIAGQSIYFNMISVFQQTFQDGKLRMDLGNAVNNIGGKFLRFPGGNNLEGIHPPNQWVWNNTIGPIEDRPGRPGTWGYYNTDGLGLLELMEWCLSMDLEPIVAVWSGYYIDGTTIDQADLQPYVDSAMNELEFLMGSSSTTYGSQRASLGYPQPFTIKYVEIGNEDFFQPSPSYQNYRFQMFYDAIHAAYPEVTVISSLCINVELQDSQCSSSTALSNPPLGVASDLHLYQSADATVALFNAFDNIPRTWPILVGEYAAIYPDDQSGPTQLNDPTLQSATAEAVMFLGLERNSDLVFGVAHGALMKSLNDGQDNVALLKHNADTIVTSYSYYVAQMFAHNFGTATAPAASDTAYGPLYWSSTVTDNGTYYVKVVNYGGDATTPITVQITGSTATTAQLITLTGPNGTSTNVLGSITSSITQTTIQGSSGTFSFTLSGTYVVAVLAVNEKD